MTISISETGLDRRHLDPRPVALGGGLHRPPPDEQGARHVRRVLRRVHHHRGSDRVDHLGGHQRGSSITTNNEQRDGHLRSADFFDPEIGGNLTFISTGDPPVRRRLRDHRRPDHQRHHQVGRPGRRVLRRRHRRVRPDRLGAEATTSINRHDFNVALNMPLDGGRLLIGPKIEINLSVEAVKA